MKPIKIHAVSDIHAEFFSDKTMPEALAQIAAEILEGNPELIILAGDIHQGAQGIQWAIDQLNPQTTGIPVVIIAGNHEFYSQRWDKVHREGRKLAAGHEGIHFLDAAGLIAGQHGTLSARAAGLTIHGATLWSDARYGSQSPMDDMSIMMDLQTGMNDYKKIKFKDGNIFRKWRVNDMRKQHARELHALQMAGTPDIMVTHHIPHGDGLNSKHTHSRSNAGYASDLTHLIEDLAVPLWIHGHSHGARSYQVGATHLANVSRGYPGEENSRFTRILFDPATRGIESEIQN